MSEAMFPIEDDIREMRGAGCTTVVIQVPWAMLAPHEEQAKRNHSQPLKRLSERGGLGADEACAVLEDRSYHDVRLTKGQAHMRLIRHIEAWRTKQATPET